MNNRDLEMLREVYEEQSYDWNEVDTTKEDDLDTLDGNEYNGLDNWSVGDLQDDKVYMLVSEKQMKAIEEWYKPMADWDGKGDPPELDEPPIGNFFFDQATYDKFVKSDGSFNATEVSEALQVGPYSADDTDEITYRTKIICFEKTDSIRAPIATCKANTQFGGGGAHQAYISDADLINYFNDGTLVPNFEETEALKVSESSSDPSKPSFVVDKATYDTIQIKSTNRCNDCFINKTRHPDEAVAKSNSLESSSEISVGENEPFGATNVVEYSREEVIDNIDSLKDGTVETDKSLQGQQTVEPTANLTKEHYEGITPGNESSGKVDTVPGDDVTKDINSNSNTPTDPASETKAEGFLGSANTAAQTDSASETKAEGFLGSAKKDGESSKGAGSSKDDGLSKDGGGMNND